MLRQRGRTMPSLRRALLILPLWIICVVWMWSWWLATNHDRFLPLFIPLSIALFYEFAVLPSVFLYFVIRAKKPSRRIAQTGLKVAVISLCVPSMESLDIVENQLKAMSAITYPHDSWILDEGNNTDIKKLAKKYGVKHFSRRGIRKYNQPHPPFQKKTKAGNVNAWLKHVKNRKYDYFVQLDIDHIPQPNYLNKTLGYFRDSQVGWVQAPSIYKNLNSWTARGAAEQELVLQGPLQMGFYGHSDTPFIIGSHCTYRMSAIEAIGGFQPTRAEDHLDTVYLAFEGYKGVFLPEIIAQGDGPETLSTYLAQQYAWAYSMFQVLLQHTPNLLRRMPWKRKLQFLFAQTWYPLWSLSYLIMFTSPLLALLVNKNVVSFPARDMLTHFAPAFICTFVIWWAARPIMQPRSLMLSWRGVILHAVRWPIILRAIIDAGLKVTKPYMITPKGTFAQNIPTLATYRPFLFLGVASAASVMFDVMLRHGNIPIAQSVYAITNATFMLTICVVDLVIRARTLKPKLSEITSSWLRPTFAALALAIILTESIFISGTLAVTQSRASADLLQTVSTAQLNNRASYAFSTDQLMQRIRKVSLFSTAKPTTGIYNPNNAPRTNQKPYIQHSFVDWRDEHYFAYVLDQSLESGNSPLITVEPRGDDNGQRLLTDIANGTYDQRLNHLAAIARASKNPVEIRFAHEMDLGDLYPWGNQDASLYIAAYRHVVDQFRQHHAANVRFIWSPAGNDGSANYYPGNAYVDDIGTTVLYDSYFYGDQRPTFSELVNNRRQLQEFGKPVWVTEFGAGHADASYQRQLIDDALKNYQTEGFSALVYLDMVDANIVGPDYRLANTNNFLK